MNRLAIKAENISKQYRLGQIGTGTISHDLNRFWHRVRGKEDPYLKIGESNDRTKKGESSYVWSLKDINFEINQGDAVGVIGRNGAGKSTLLKLLSRVTQPTTGKFKVNGRIASLLEVGTGFNPEMTGRENIYLNGAILGMRSHEITRKFEEIVSFSGVEKYIDTPVKRYSSGMYVRLAFAVAAHLESEILIVDEVLAVGDSEFQKKCLGKMGEVSGTQGRTVLFVSHNMSAVRNLCTKGILLNNGTNVLNGNIDQIISGYEKLFYDEQKVYHIEYPYQAGKNMQLISAELKTQNNLGKFYSNQSLIFEFLLEANSSVPNAYITIDIFNFSGDLIYWTSDHTTERFKRNLNGKFTIQSILPEFLLTAGSYYAVFAIFSPSYGAVDYHEKYKIFFDIEENEQSFLSQFGISHPGVTAIPSQWQIIS
jgi:lipopolysaccharide transport system ATP-binding protein